MHRPTLALLAGTALLITAALVIGLSGSSPPSVADWTAADLQAVGPTPAADEVEAQAVAARSSVEEPVEPDVGDFAAGTVALGPLRTVRGRVVDAQGRPVASALVQLQLRSSGRFAKGGERVKRPATSATDGTFGFRGPLGGIRRVMLAAQHADFAPATVERELAPEGDDLRLQDIILTPGGSIAGVVVDVGGTGLVDAEVELQLEGSALRGALPGDAKLLTPTQRTGGGGAFRFDHVPAGATRVQARASRHLPAASELATIRDGSAVTLPPIVLADGCALDGLVTDGRGNPVAGARAWVSSERPGPTQTGETAADGRFRVDHLPRGPATLRVAKRGFVSHEAQIDLAASERVTVVLADGLRVSGTVRDSATGAPLTEFAAEPRRLAPARAARKTPADQYEGLLRKAPVGSEARSKIEEAMLRAHAPDPRMSAFQQWQDLLQRLPKETGPPSHHPEGAFVFDGLDEGLWVIDVAAVDHQAVRSEPFELALGRPVVLDIAVPRGHHVSGRVVDHAGTGISGAAIEMALVPPIALGQGRPGGTTVARAVSQADGSFILRHAPPGTAIVTATGKDHEAQRTEPFTLASDVAGLTLVLGRRASVAGRVLGIPEGRSPEVTVVAVAAFRQVTSRPVAADGSYRIEGLRAGPYHVAAFLGDPRDATRRALQRLRPEPTPPPPDVTLVAGEERQLDLELRAPRQGRVAGHVRCNGAPANGWTVRIVAAEPHAESPEVQFFDQRYPVNRTVEADASFLFAEIDVGRHDLRVIGPSRAELLRQVILVQEGMTTNVELDLAVGGIDGEIVAADAESATLSGALRLFRDAAAVPEDVEEWERTGRVVHVRFRAGRFRVDELPAGSYCVEIRGGRERAAAVQQIDVPPGPPQPLRLTAGPRLAPAGAGEKR